jgi:hypothetical protein
MGEMSGRIEVLADPTALARHVAEWMTAAALVARGAHTAIDHPWVMAHPDFYVEGSEKDLTASPENYCRVETDHGPRILAHGAPFRLVRMKWVLAKPSFLSRPEILHSGVQSVQLKRLRKSASAHGSRSRLPHSSRAVPQIARTSRANDQPHCTPIESG